MKYLIIVSLLIFINCGGEPLKTEDTAKYIQDNMYPKDPDTQSEVSCKPDHVGGFVRYLCYGPDGREWVCNYQDDNLWCARRQSNEI